MLRPNARVLGVLALLCCQQQGSVEPVAPLPFAAWEATEQRLEDAAKGVSSQLEVLARQPGNDAAVEAVEALARARAELHKVRLTVVADLSGSAKTATDAAVLDQQQKAAEARMDAAVNKVEKRIALGQKLLGPTAPAAPPKAEPKEE